VPRHRLALVIAAALTATACAGADPIETLQVASTTTTPVTTIAGLSGNGELTIGVLVPSTGPGAQLGSGLIGAIRLAVDRIAEAGGVLGSPIRLIEADEGGTVSSALLGLDSLLTAGVDAIVGPASSLAALSVVPAAVSAGVLTCSPTATALSLDELPDDGLFFRTIPSDSLQAVAIAQAAELTGATQVSIGYVDDTYGRGLVNAVTTALTARNLEVLVRRGVLLADGDLADAAAELLAPEPGVVIVLADADVGGRLLAELGVGVEGRPIPRFVVNDAIRGARSSQAITGLTDQVRSQVVGVSPLALATDRNDFPAAYAAYAYDCVNLIALAAERAGSDAPRLIAAQMAAVSVGGSVCRSFEGCIDRLRDDLQIDYQGASGRLEISARTGDPTQGRFELFNFDAAGGDVSGTAFDATSR